MLTKDQLANVVRSGNSRFPTIGRLSIFNTEMTAHSAQPDRSPAYQRLRLAYPSVPRLRLTAATSASSYWLHAREAARPVRAGANESVSQFRQRATDAARLVRQAFLRKATQLSALVALSLEGGALQPRRRPISSPRWRSLRPATVLAELIWHCASRRATRAGPYVGRASRSACTFWLLTQSGGVARMSVIRTLPVASALLSRARPMRISFALRNASSR
jgi:hypothetical protein